MNHHENKTLVSLSEEVDGILYVEEWKDIKGYEGRYKISSFGRVKSLAKSWVAGNYNGTINKKEKIIKGQIIKGYLSFRLKNQSGYRGFLGHRLVGFSFIPNPENKPQINHLRGNRLDNRYWMLEWVTRSENEIHAYRVLGKKPSTTWKNNFKRVQKSIICTTTGEQFKTMNEAAEKLGLKRRSINKVCNGVRKSIKKLHFKYI